MSPLPEEMGQTGGVLPLPGLLYVALSVPITSGESPGGLWFCPSWAVKRPDLRTNSIHLDNPDFTSASCNCVNVALPAQMPVRVLASPFLRTVRKTQGLFHF